MITQLKVWLTLPGGGTVQVGELAVKDPDERGSLVGQFRYLPDYLQSTGAFALDPLHLPLLPRFFDADRPHSGVHGVFEDSLPDDWGRTIMARRFRLGRTEQRVPHLLRLLGDQGLGAPVYSAGDEPPPQTAGVSSRHLAELALLAEKFEQDPQAAANDEFALLFQAGSSPGGARPKALVVDDSGAWLAKFASVRDQLDVVALEAAVMEMARRAGIRAAQTRLVSLGPRRCLLVRRFDINEAGGRNHLISMQSLLKADGYYTAGYRDLAEIIKQVAAAPQVDLQMLYRQMLLNVLVGNTDDHLKNFCMLHDDQGWHLSPAFDLVPNIGFNQEHVLQIGLDSRPRDGESLLAEAKYFGIKRRQAALEVLAEVSEAVADWQRVCAECAVPAHDVQVLGGDIEQRLKRYTVKG